MHMPAYRELRPYRNRNDKTENYLCSIMDERFAQGFADYWEQFGFEIGGPVCYGFVQWIIEQVKAHPEITDLAFVARDGWLLKRIYEILQPDSMVKTHYVYASRALKTQCESAEGRREYQQYINAIGFSTGVIGIIDTVTMNFSSLRLIKENVDNDVIGLFWCVLHSIKDYDEQYSYQAFQKERYHTIRNWNVMEFIMTAPEAPIELIHDKKPIYKDNIREKKRQAIYEHIIFGVIQFVETVHDDKEKQTLSNQSITLWVNKFLAQPTDADKTAFADIRFSENDDHSDDILLDPFGENKNPTIKTIKDKVWYWSLGHKKIYKLLHGVNQIRKQIMQVCKTKNVLCYNGENLEEIYQVMLRYDVISFDIFDTLILRPYKKPTDLFYDLEKENGLTNFHDQRIRAEQTARACDCKPNGEVNIFDIYEELAKTYQIDSKAYAYKEIEKELEVCYANPDMLKLYEKLRAAGKRMIGVSDMYLPLSVLKSMLYKSGYTSINSIYVSCEYGVNKRQSGLQKKVSAIIGKEQHVCHLGDNYYSDVLGSKATGWDAVLVKNGPLSS